MGKWVNGVPIISGYQGPKHELYDVEEDPDGEKGSYGNLDGKTRICLAESPNSFRVANGVSIPLLFFIAPVSKSIDGVFHAYIKTISKLQLFLLPLSCEKPLLSPPSRQARDSWTE